MKKQILLVFISVFAVNLYSQIGSFLSWGVSSKSLGMGRAQTAVCEDGSAAFYNPSLLAKVKKFEFLGSYSIFYADSGYTYLSFVSPTIYGSFAVGIQNIATGDIIQRDITGKPLGTLDTRITGIYFAFGSNTSSLIEQIKPADFIDIYNGATIKIISEKIYNKESGAIALDFSSQIDFDFDFYSLLFGFNLGNIISTPLKFYEEEQIPFISRVGLGLLLFDKTLKLAGDIVLSKQINDINLGLEYTVWNLLSLRVGSSNEEITMGFSITRQNLQFSYAFMINKPWEKIDLGYIHSIDFKIQWTTKKKK